MASLLAKSLAAVSLTFLAVAAMPGCDILWGCAKTGEQSCTCGSPRPNGEPVDLDQCAMIAGDRGATCCVYDGKTCTCGSSCMGSPLNRVVNCRRGSGCPDDPTDAPSICGDIGFSCTIPNEDETCDPWTCTCEAPGKMSCGAACS